MKALTKLIKPSSKSKSAAPPAGPVPVSSVDTSKKSAINPSTEPVVPALLPIDQFIGKFVMPDEEYLLTNSVGDVQQVCLLGPGLKVKLMTTSKNNNTADEDSKQVVVVCKAGILAKKKPNTFYVDVLLRNYTPAAKEDVIGIIAKKAGDQYLVDIGTRDRLTLSKFSFEGATKKNRPDLKIGDAVFGRILSLPSDYPYEITCVTTPSGKSHGLGPLENGFVFRVPVHMIQKLHTVADENGDSFELLIELGKVKNVPFEVAIGANGFIWVKSKSMVINILISQVIQAAVDLPVSEYKRLVHAYQQSTDVLRTSQ